MWRSGITILQMTLKQAQPLTFKRHPRHAIVQIGEVFVRVYQVEHDTAENFLISVSCFDRANDLVQVFPFSVGVT